MYYKVVDENLKSIFVNPNQYCSDKEDLDGRTRFCVQYEFGKWISSNVSGTSLMVFSNLYAARSFLFQRSDKIFECEVVKTIDKPFFTDVSLLNWAYEKYINNERCPDYSNLIMSHTVFCDKVKLVKEVLL